MTRAYEAIGLFFALGIGIAAFGYFGWWPMYRRFWMAKDGDERVPRKKRLG